MLHEFSRFTQESKGHSLPSNVLEELEKTLIQTYPLANGNYIVQGELFDGEFLLAVNILPEGPEGESMTYFASLELKKGEDFKAIQSSYHKLVDSVGVFIEKFLAQYSETAEDEDVMSPCDWTEANFEGLDFMYRISKENLYLLEQANRLLQDH